VVGGSTVFADPPEDSPVANIVVKIGNSGDYEEGDVIVAMNSKSTLFVQAEQLTHPKKMQRKSNGNIESGSLLEDFYESVREYKFERISDTEVRRTRRFISDASTEPVTYTPVNMVDVLSDTPNLKGEFIHVQKFIERNRQIVFGNSGSEYWYGGETMITDTKMGEVWDEIESKTSQVRNYNFSFSEQEKKSFAVLKVDDMTNAEIGELTSPEIVDGVVTRARRKKINLSAVLNSSEMSALSDPESSHDFRGRKINIQGSIMSK
jgi:hypothetical protein